MHFDIVSIFPEYLEPLKLSLVGKAIEDERITVRVWDLREFTHDRHRTVDDTPYGGGPGMVMKPEPWGEALDAILASPPFIGAQPTFVVPTHQATARDLVATQGFSLLCGRYEGFDQRALDLVVDDEISVGDFVLAGGELAALCIVEAVVRLLPGALGNDASSDDESFSEGLLEYPHYTKPAEFRGRVVPDVLRSGDHARVDPWRRAAALRRTAARRPDLYAAYELTSDDETALREFPTD